MKTVYDDGGREAAWFKGKTRDCVTRAIAIATGMRYPDVYSMVNEVCKRERPGIGVKRSARTGVGKEATRALLRAMGWNWTPTMGIGQGCKVHLREGELPMGRLIVSVSKHLVAVIDGVIHDTHDPSRNGTRCVYGYWTKEDSHA